MNEWAQKRKLLRRYNSTAKMYDLRYSEEQIVKYKAALKHLRIPQKSAVLDVGCGTGLFFSYIANRIKAIAAIDISKELLLKAKERARLFNNIFLVQSDADHLPFRINHFNAIFAFTVLQNMPKPLKTLSEVKSIAKSNALIVVSGLKKAFSSKAFMDLLKNVGLRIVAIEDADEIKGYVAVTVKI